MAIDIKEILANGLLDLCHKKDLSQITVKDLLETTGVSRQTFYNHFLDKNDLIQYIYIIKLLIILMDKIQILIFMNHL